MGRYFATANLGNGRSIPPLARQTFEAGADHPGFNGYFVFEAGRQFRGQGHFHFGQSSLEAAFRLIDLWGESQGSVTRGGGSIYSIRLK
jgi:hypothetical protein